MFCYFIKSYRHEVKMLKKIGFAQLNLFKTRSWRIGKELDHAYRRYYTGFYDGQKCFIKIAENDSTIENELFVAKNLIGKKFTFISKIICIDSSFDGNKKMLATIFTKGLHPLSKESIYHDVETVRAESLLDYCRQMRNILQQLEKIKLVHADIHKGNLMLDENDHLILLDFGISKFLDKGNNVDYISRPGTFYRNTSGGRIYDDAYSFIQMINRYDAIKDIMESGEYKSIVERIDKVAFTVNIVKK